MSPAKPFIGSKLLRQIFLIMMLALLYFVSGRLGLLLAIPPGYATAVWPASGFALAGLLLYGNRLWPGILLGSFLVNIPTSFDTLATETTVRAFMLAFSIGTGATLQAFAGAILIKRYVDVESGLVRAKDIVLFMALGGPLSCLIASTWGVTTLWLFDLVSNNEYPFSWITWWVGDTIGVLLIVPLLMIWFGHPRKVWAQKSTRVALPMITMLILIVTFFVVASKQEQARIENNFNEQALLLGDALEKRLLKSVEVLHSIQSFFYTSNLVERTEFEKYAQRAIKRNPAIQALSWNPVLTPQLRATFEQEAQSQGFPDFTVTERDSEGNLVNAGMREKYVIVHYIEPVKGNEMALGFDVYSNPSRRQAMDLASSTGDLAATDPIRLVQETGNQAGVLFFMPVYLNAEVPQEEDREDLLKGFAVGVFRAEDLLTEALESFNMANVDILLFTETDSAIRVPLANYSYDGQGQGKTVELKDVANTQSPLLLTKELHYGQKTWTLQVKATTEYLARNRSWTAWGVLTVGLLFTTLLGMFLMVLTGQAILDQSRVDELASEVERRTSAEQALLSANRQLEILAKTDPLTQIHNRRSIQEICTLLDAEVKHSQFLYSAIMLDVDSFKKVNDQWGHDVGDQVLRKISNIIQNEIRDTDYIGRWGGEEFIVLSRTKTPEDSVHYAERLCQAIRLNTIEPVGRMTISVGVATNKIGELSSDVIMRADKALYMAKDNGRNRVEFLA